MNLSQSYASGGSVNSAQSNGWSQSGTNANDARAWSEAQSALAWSRDMDALQMQMAFNAAEAQKQRDWQERMANTVYTRSVANMREAGINPILAANMGLSGAAVGSGATASIGGTPSAPLAQNFMDTWSASQNASESHGSSWQSSEGGLITALSALGSALAKGLGAIQSGMNLSINMAGFEDMINNMENIKNQEGWNNHEYQHTQGDLGVSRNTEANHNVTNFLSDLAGDLWNGLRSVGGRLTR